MERMERATLRKKATLQAELSTRLLPAPPTTQSQQQLTDWAKRELERHVKLDEQVDALNQVYLNWIQEERTRRLALQRKLDELSHRCVCGMIYLLVIWNLTRDILFSMASSAASSLKKD